MSKSVDTAAAVPRGEHWAIIRSSSVFVPGDERSRTAPGHGYPEHTDNYITYRAFDKEADFKREMDEIAASRYAGDRRDVIGIHVTETFGLVNIVKVLKN